VAIVIVVVGVVVRGEAHRRRGTPGWTIDVPSQQLAGGAVCWALPPLAFFGIIVVVVVVVIVVVVVFVIEVVVVISV
jgi:hypothetical protein